eukprot:6204162-Pleurochrysis_carterae.AAC.3
MSATPASSRCPSQLCGVWEQQQQKCESLCPLLTALGMPKAMLWAACPIADRTQTTLRITCPENVSNHADTLEVVDKTIFGRNATTVLLDGSEIEKKTKGRGKTYMLSGFNDASGRSVIQCRCMTALNPLCASLSRSLLPLLPARYCLFQAEILSLHRLITRGEGWVTRQERYLSGDNEHGSTPTLVERHVLTRPDKEDLVIHRYYSKTPEDVLQKAD